MRTPLAPNLHFYEILKMTSSVANCWSAIVAAICSIPILFGLLIKKPNPTFATIYNIRDIFFISDTRSMCKIFNYLQHVRTIKGLSLIHI